MLEEQKKCFKNKRNKALFIKVRFQYKKGSELWSFKSEYEERIDQKMGQIFLAAFLVNQ